MSLKKTITTKRSLQKSLATTLAAVLVFSISGCMSIESVNNLKGVERLPRPAQTYVSDHLACISDMIAEYRYALDDGNPQPIRIALPSVKDRTSISSRDYPESEIPNDMTDMALGIASRIGGPIRLVHVPDTNEILDAARVDSQPERAKFFDGFQFSHYRPDTLILYGALTEYDRITSAREKTLDIDGEFGGGSGETTLEYSKLNGRNQARMTMDFRVVHPAVGDIVNHASSTNSIDLYMIARDRSYAISVDGNTIGFAKAYSDVDARHQALRMLIEMGIIESIAKFFYVPYWKCYPNVDTSKMIDFADYFEQPQKLHFDPFSSPEAVKEVVNPVPAEGVVKVEEVKESKKQPPQDYRDSELIHSLLFYFHHDEFLHNSTRHHIRRQENDVAFNISGSQIPVEGKQNKLRKILALYRKNVASFQASTDQAIYSRMYKSFVERLMISEDDSQQEERMFLGLWLNAPIRKNARWDYL